MAGSERNSILCPNCRKLISRDDSKCPYCGTTHPGAWWKNNAWTRGFLSEGLLIKAIICANAAMYAISLLLGSWPPAFSSNPLSFLSPDDRTLFLLGATGTVPIDRLHRWWTLVSANFLHGSILHILFNMLALRQIGPFIAQEYGGYRMVILYILGGALGFLASYLAGVSFTVGASAAVCSLIGAALYYGKSRGGVYGQAIYRQIGGWALGIFLFGMLAPGIDNWGHGGGMLAGVALGLLLGYAERRRENLFHKILAGCCVFLVAAVLMWAVGFATYFRLFG